MCIKFTKAITFWKTAVHSINKGGALCIKGRCTFWILHWFYIFDTNIIFLRFVTFSITIADFYSVVWIFLPIETKILTLEDHPTLNKWLNKVMEVKEIAAARAKYRKMLNMGLFMMKWIMPVMKCCTCQCCCPKKKK